MSTHKPDVIIHECVPGFDQEVLAGFLNLIEERERDIYIYICIYDVSTVVWSPVQFGHPVERRRRYTLRRLKHRPKCLASELDSELSRSAVLRRCILA